MKAALTTRLASVILTTLLAVAACSRDAPARLVTAIEGPAVADPLVFHGSCFAGWSVRVELVVRETAGADVWMDHLELTLTDAGPGLVMGEDSLDAAAIESRYGQGLVPGHGSVSLSVSALTGLRPVGPVVVSGAVRGRDEHGDRVGASFDLTAPSLVVNDPPLAPGGACSAG